MNEFSVEVREKIVESDIPDSYQPLVFDLFSKFGFEWIVELYECEEPKGTGAASLSIDLFEMLDNDAKVRLQATIDEMLKLVKEHNEIHGEPNPNPYEAIDEFVETIEFLDWEDDLMEEFDYKKQILQTWFDLKIDYYRSVKKLKIDFAREEANKEVESMDIGGEELSCRKCGVIFYDNLSKHFGIRNLYCSISCESLSILKCVQCGVEYEVGRGPARIRVIRLEGFCSTECLGYFKDLKEADNKYRYSMKRTASEFKVSFDDSITRREVFKRGNGKIGRAHV